MTRTRVPCPVAPEVSHVVDGRITSALITTATALDNAANRHGAPRWCARSQLAATGRHPAPAASAPAAIHRCCQVRPGWSASQSSSRPTPTARSRWLSGLSRTNGGAVNRCSTTFRGCSVAGHDAGTARAGNRVRAARRASGRCGRVATGRVSTVVVIGSLSRTGSPATRAGIPAPPAEPSDELPAESVRRGGPAIAE